MIVQISSGQGPVECEIAVSKLYEVLKREYPDIKEINKHRSRFSDGYTSIMFTTGYDLSDMEGSVQWVCKSPVRQNHKRKNWFIDVSVIDEVEAVCKNQDIRIERFHCGGNGGQNVNKVETGVRVVHVPTGIAVTSTAQRSQLQNRNDAIRKLNAILTSKELENKAKQSNDAWREHNRIQRGNAVRVYRGKDFKLSEK